MSTKSKVPQTESLLCFSAYLRYRNDCTQKNLTAIENWKRKQQEHINATHDSDPSNSADTISTVRR